MDDSKNVYPVCTGTVDEEAKKLFHNVNVGGLTMREHVAIEFAKALLSNATFVASGMAMEQLQDSAILAADRFLIRLKAEMVAIPPKSKIETLDKKIVTP